MFRRILVGVDGHQGGRDAIALAKLLLHRRAKLTLAHVYASDMYMYRSASAAYAAAEAERSREMLEAARTATGTDARLRSRMARSVGQGLHELCEIVDCDLLVVGSSRRGLPGRVLLGDDTRASLDSAPCALAIAPLGYAEQAAVVREVGVAYNGSPESGHALTVARGIAAEYQAKLSAFEAVTLPSLTYVPDPKAVEETLDGLLDEARERITALGGLEPHTAFGLAADELALYSASIDLLVVGSRGYGPVARLFYGSVTRQLLRRARCPLLILTRAAREGEADRTTSAL